LLLLCFFFLVIRLLRPSSLFPYTTLFRSTAPSPVPGTCTFPACSSCTSSTSRTPSTGSTPSRPLTGTTPSWATGAISKRRPVRRSEEHTSELQSRENLVCRLLLEKKKIR